MVEFKERTKAFLHNKGVLLSRCTLLPTEENLKPALDGTYHQLQQATTWTESLRRVSPEGLNHTGTQLNVSYLFYRNYTGLRIEPRLARIISVWSTWNCEKLDGEKKEIMGIPNTAKNLIVTGPTFAGISYQIGSRRKEEGDSVYPPEIELGLAVEGAKGGFRWNLPEYSPEQPSTFLFQYTSVPGNYYDNNQSRRDGKRIIIPRTVTLAYQSLGIEGHEVKRENGNVMTVYGRTFFRDAQGNAYETKRLDNTYLVDMVGKAHSEILTGNKTSNPIPLYRFWQPGTNAPEHQV